MIFSKAKAKTRRESEMAREADEELKRRPQEIARLATKIASRMGERHFPTTSSRIQSYKDAHILVKHTKIASSHESIEVWVPKLERGVLAAYMPESSKSWKVSVYHPGEWERYLKEVLWPQAEDKPESPHDSSFGTPIKDWDIFKDVFEH